MLRTAKYKRQIHTAVDWIWAPEYAADYDDKSAAASKARATRRAYAQENPPTPEQVAKRAAAFQAARKRLKGRFEREVLPMEDARQRNLERSTNRNKMLATPEQLWAGFLWLFNRSGDKDARLVWATENAALNLDKRRETAKATAEAIQRRLEVGFEWAGGKVGTYDVPAMVYPGLVSDEHPILKRFVSKLPRRRCLVSGMHKADAMASGSKLLSLDDPYIEGNKQMRGMLRVELDSRLPSWDAIETACKQCGVLVPKSASPGWTRLPGKSSGHT
jgi:hypothetical protein